MSSPASIDTVAGGDATATARAAQVVGDVVERFGAGRIALAASWQKETAVLLDLVVKHAPGARIFTLDTGVLFPETYETWKRVEERYGIQVESYKGTWVDGMWLSDPDKCCMMRKVEPMKRALDGMECWITGLRREQSEARANTPELSWDDRNGLHKACPVASWTERDVWSYIFEHDLPYNPLHDQGYQSIGCTHCTLAGDGREGRWAGSGKSECGLHA